MRKKAIIGIVVVLLVISLFYTATGEIPGAKIVALDEDSEVIVTFISSEAGANNEFGLHSPQHIVMGYGHSTPPGTSFNLGTFPAGTELIFYISPSPSYVYYSGPGDRNPDGVVHAAVTELGYQLWELGFEDVWMGGDQDYNDVILNVEGGLKIIDPYGPIADFDWSPKLPEGIVELQFTDLSTDPNDDIVSWFWTFDDGDTSTEQHPSHEYLDTRNYDVTLIVMDATNLTDSITKTVNFYNFPPEILDVHIDGEPAKIYGLSSKPDTITLTATANDTNTGGSEIGGANYTFGHRKWSTVQPMDPVDGTWNDDVVEDVTITFSTPADVGTYTYCVYGWDIWMNYNTVGACAELTILDDMPPEIYDVLIDDEPHKVYGLSELPHYVTLTAVVDDTNTGNSYIGTIQLGGANYTHGAWNWITSQPMQAIDSTWEDDVVEPVMTSIPTPTMSATYTYCVYGWDQWLNYNTTGACARLTIVDDMPPEIYDVKIDGEQEKTYYTSELPQEVTLTGAIDDTNTGKSFIGGGNYTLGQFNWSSAQDIDPLDGSWDDDIVEHVTITFSTPTAPGRYTYCVYGWDVVPNYNTTSTACALLIISEETPPDVPEIYPPDIIDVRAEPDPQTVGGKVTISATVVDEDTPQEDLIVTIELKDPEEVSLGTYLMNYNPDTGEWTFTSHFILEGTYTFEIWAYDPDNQSDNEDGYFDMEPESDVRPYNWKPIIALSFMIILLFTGIFFIYKRPIRFKGIIQKDRMYTFLLGVLPFTLAEGATGLISHFTGLLCVPPLIGWGMIVDLIILFSGIVVYMVIFKRGKDARTYETMEHEQLDEEALEAE